MRLLFPKPFRPAKRVTTVTLASVPVALTRNHAVIGFARSNCARDCRSAILAAALAFSAVAPGQTVPATRPQAPPGDIVTHPEWPKAAEGDVDSVEHLVAALSDVISGPPTKPRDWNRFRSLFLPDGKLGPVLSDRPAKDGRPARTSDVAFLTPDMYAQRVQPLFQSEGFFERNIASRTEVFGNLIHVWSTYEVRHGASDVKPFTRGINSIQIVHAAGRFWVANVMWDDELNGFALPDKYLAGPQP